MEEVVALWRFESQEGLQFAPRGVQVPQMELAPHEKLADGEVGRIEAERLPAGRGRGAPVATLEVEWGQFGPVVRAPGADLDGTEPVGDGLLHSPPSGREGGRPRQRGFSVGLQGEGRPEGGQGVSAPGELAESETLG